MRIYGYSIIMVPMEGTGTRVRYKLMLMDMDTRITMDTGIDTIPTRRLANRLKYAITTLLDNAYRNGLEDGMLEVDKIITHEDMRQI